MKSVMVGFISAIVCILMGCSTSIETGSLPSGSLSGNVIIVDPRSRYIMPDQVDIVVDSGPLRTLTDSAGNWKLSAIPIGTHTIRISKPGYGRSEIFNVKVLAGETDSVRQGLLTIPAEGIIEVDTVYCLATPGLLLTKCHSVSALGIAEFIDTSDNVQPTDLHLYASMPQWIEGHYWRAQYDLDQLRFAGLHSGEVLYYSSCDFTPGNKDITNTSYFDARHDQWRIVSGGPRSRVVRFVMP